MDSTLVKPVLPLEKRKRCQFDPRTGREEELPALHPSWCQSVHFLPYSCARRDDPQWAEAIELIDRDLRWLLTLDHAQFWNQVIFDASLQEFLDSYLRLAPRDVSQYSHEKERSVHRRVFATFVRLSTHKESTQDFFSEEAFAEILYQNFLFDVPKILDLCHLYGNCNAPLLKKMVANLFDKQPKYFSDLKTALGELLQILDRTAKETQSVEHSTKSSLEAKGKVEDLVLFLADTAATLRSFVSIFPPGAKCFWEVGAVTKLAAFYDDVFPAVQHLWKKMASSLPHLKFELRRAKCHWIDTLHLLLEEFLVKAESRRPNCEDIMTVLMSLLSAPQFLKQFERQHSFKETVERVMDANKQCIAEGTRQYLREAVDLALVSHQTEERRRDQEEVPKVAERADWRTSRIEMCLGWLSNTIEATANPESKAVKEVLPYLSDSAIASFLKGFGNDSSAVITAILEDRLPPPLKALLEREGAGLKDDGPAAAAESVSKPQESKKHFLRQPVTMETPLLDARHSIYDNDEFDVFHRQDVDLSKVRKGKQLLSKGLLNERSSHHLTKARVLESFEYEVDEYDDEYDDTYDTAAVRIKEPTHGDDFEDVSDEDADNDETPSSGGPTADSSLHQPVVGQSDRHTHGGRTQGGRNKPGVNRRQGGDGRGSVAMAPRHQDWKEKHKSSFANHNRKREAQRKHQRGMF